MMSNGRPNGLTFSRELREDSFEFWTFVARGSPAATFCSAAFEARLFSPE
jgi:hypothetical protein